MNKIFKLMMLLMLATTSCNFYGAAAAVESPLSGSWCMMSATKEELDKAELNQKLDTIWNFCEENGPESQINESCKLATKSDFFLIILEKVKDETKRHLDTHRGYYQKEDQYYIDHFNPSNNKVFQKLEIDSKDHIKTVVNQIVQQGMKEVKESSKTLKEKSTDVGEIRKKTMEAFQYCPCFQQETNDEYDQQATMNREFITDSIKEAIDSNSDFLEFEKIWKNAHTVWDFIGVDTKGFCQSGRSEIANFEFASEKEKSDMLAAQDFCLKPDGAYSLKDIEKLEQSITCPRVQLCLEKLIKKEKEIKLFEAKSEWIKVFDFLKFPTTFHIFGIPIQKDQDLTKLKPVKKETSAVSSQTSKDKSSSFVIGQLARCACPEHRIQFQQQYAYEAEMKELTELVVDIDE